MRASIRIEFIVGETTVFRKVIYLPISFDNFKVKEKKK